MQRGIHAGFVRFRSMVVRWAIVLSCLWLGISQAKDRIWVPVKINGKRAQFIFDTGAYCPLFCGRAVAERFGLWVTDPPTNAVPAPGQVLTGETEEFSLKMWGARVRAQFRVYDAPKGVHMDSDGMIGWGCVVSNIIQIDATRQKVACFDRLPKQVATWTKIPLHTNSDILHLEFSQGGNTNELVEVDTGDTVGVALSPDKWRAWRAAHPKQPLTLHRFFMGGSGWVVKEEAWAKELSLGPLVLTDVPVTEASPTQVTIGSPQFGASLGMAALKRLDLIVDAPHGMAYLRPKTTRPQAYQHNRLGAVFAQPALQGKGMVAQVVDGSPAYEAGVRNGDVLSHVTIHWGLIPRLTLRHFPDDEFQRGPAGTKLDLTLNRGGKTLKATAILRDIVAPGDAKP